MMWIPRSRVLSFSPSTRSRVARADDGDSFPFLRPPFLVQAYSTSTEDEWLGLRKFTMASLNDRLPVSLQFMEKVCANTTLEHAFYPCQPVKISPKTRLGSGIGMREIGADAGLIEGWRKSVSYGCWARERF